MSKDPGKVALIFSMLKIIWFDRLVWVSCGQSWGGDVPAIGVYQSVMEAMALAACLIDMPITLGYFFSLLWHNTLVKQSLSPAR